MFGGYVIRFLQKKQIGEVIRDLGLEGQMAKKGTPTMGGLLILASILIPTLLFARLSSIYIILMLITTVWLGAIGFIDDYIKVFKKNKAGLPGKLKLVGQVGIGLIVGLSLYVSKDVVVYERVYSKATLRPCDVPKDAPLDITRNVKEVKSTKTTIPFMKNNEFDYSDLVKFTGEHAKQWGWVVFVLAVILITTAVSNGANITDGIDGLAAGTSAIIGATLGIFAYLSGNIIYADYLNIMYIPMSGELLIFAAAFMGATIGFLWYNTYPAQIFMGDTGSLAIGGIIAVFAILIRKELLIPMLCGIFLVENLSVMIQVGYFKYTRIRFGEGRRVFLMAPLHHHYQKKNFPEAKIVVRFWLIGIALAVGTIITLKIR
jgi:phospho-N-acetylmuramoyl-pentapeptide-transferase